MGLFDSLLSSVGSGQNSAIGNTLLSLLASESGRTSTSDDKVGTQSSAAISSGLSELVQRFEKSGLGDVIQSWIGSGPNQPIGTDQLHQAIGPETVDRLSQSTGMVKGELLPLIAQMLPTIVDHLTPNQHVPDEGELSADAVESADRDLKSIRKVRTRERRVGNVRTRPSISLSRRDRVGSSNPAGKNGSRCALRHDVVTTPAVMAAMLSQPITPTDWPSGSPCPRWLDQYGLRTTAAPWGPTHPAR